MYTCWCFGRVHLEHRQELTFKRYRKAESGQKSFSEICTICNQLRYKWQILKPMKNKIYKESKLKYFYIFWTLQGQEDRTVHKNISEKSKTFIQLKYKQLQTTNSYRKSMENKHVICQILSLNHFIGFNIFNMSNRHFSTRNAFCNLFLKFKDSKY